MDITITLTDEEITKRPNDSDLGSYVRQKYWKHRQEPFPVDDEHVFLDITPDGYVRNIVRPWECGICGKDTSMVEMDYLVGYDHLGCHLKKQSMAEQKDKCVICGKETPYSYSTHIDLRVGYVEGAGQGCFQPNLCKPSYNR